MISRQQKRISQYSTTSDIDSFYFKQEFQLYYQPVLLLDNQSLYAFEEVTYWQPSRAKLYSSKPLTIAERSQLDIPFHQWIIDEACRQLHNWEIQQVEGALSYLSVNLSAKPLFHSYLAEYIAQSLYKTGIDPSYLQIEIPAKWIMQNRLAAKSTINRFIKAGISISIDELHFSDLSYEDWFNLPIKELKVRKINVEEFSENSCMRDFLKRTISIANKTGIQVIPQDIETDQQLLIMKALGCTYGQGSLLSSPLSPRQATALMFSYVNKLKIEMASYLSSMIIINKTAQKLLGKTLVSKYWYETKPKKNWLRTIEPDKNLELLLDLEQFNKTDVSKQKDLQCWSSSFIQRCSAVIRDFPQLLDQSAMTPTETKILTRCRK